MTALIATPSLPTARPIQSMTRQVLALALPVLAQQALVLAVSLSDRWLAGHLKAGNLQSAYQAAQNTGNYLGWFISSYTVLVSVCATAVVARCVGAKEWPEAQRAMHQAIILGLLVGIAGALTGLLGMDYIVSGLQLQGQAAAFAAQYLRPMFWLLPFQVLEAAGIACLVGAGDTRTGLFVQGGVALLNVPMAWILCFGIGTWPGVGFVGIALGTSLSYLCGAVAVLATLAVGRAGLRFRISELIPHGAMLYRLLRVSAPAALDSLSVVAGQFWFLGIVNRLGDTASAAHGTALGWEALAFLSAHSFGIASMSLVGRNLGARKPEVAAQAGWTSLALGGSLTCFMGLLFFSFAPAMVRFFNGSLEQIAIVNEAVPVLRLVALATPALASTIIFTQSLRGAGDTRVPVLFTWFGFLGVRIPLAYWLTGPMGLGLYGAWLAMCADLFVRGTFFFLRFLGGRWKLARV